MDYPHSALKRVADMQPSMVVPMNFFDYDSWDKFTKPANFNMKVPESMKAEALRRETAAALRINVPTPIYNGRSVRDVFSLDSEGFCFQDFPTSMSSEDFYDIQSGTCNPPHCNSCNPLFCDSNYQCTPNTFPNV